jgi:hypothetical protein
MRTNFVLPGHRKKRLGRCCLSDVFVGEWSLELIICVLDVLKNELREIYETMIQRVERPWELILCFLDIEKCDLYEVA